MKPGVLLFLASGLIFSACSSTSSDQSAPSTTKDDATSTDIKAPPTDTGQSDVQTDKDTVMTDTATAEDTSETSAKDTARPQDNDVNIPTFNCNPEGSWTLNIKSDLKQGDGCGKDGTPGQKDNQQVYIVERQTDGTLIGKLPAMKEPTPVITVTQVAADTGCAIDMTMAASIVFPPDNNGVVDTVTAAYNFSLNQLDGSITGGGQVHMTTITDKGIAKVDCKEPLSITGQFSAKGQ